ncbi:hypothetical protein ACIHEI_12740 [Kitasatospora sp. NPDC051984]|uniref:hypothetical protein n=1 Tax=Kitasatospora sp. NPDC051984 TaxID=3364059 RepID=UPI0037C66467
MTPLAALLAFHEARLPPARAVPEPPPGYTVLDTDEGCGNGHSAVCWRTLQLSGPPGVPTAEAADRLRPRQRCEPNGYLLDRRDVCTEVSIEGSTIDYAVLLSNE